MERSQKINKNRIIIGLNTKSESESLNGHTIKNELHEVGAWRAVGTIIVGRSTPLINNWLTL